MFNRGLKKYISNPVIGLLPFILFILLHTLKVHELYALAWSLLFAFTGECIIRLSCKTRAFSISFIISFIAIAATVIIWILTRKSFEKPNTYVVISEIIIICLLMLFRASRTYIAGIFFRKKNLFQKAQLNEYYSSARFIQYGLTLHIFSILIYRQFKIDLSYRSTTDLIMFCVLPILVLLTIGTYQLYMISSIASKLKKEEWLPIVTEKGEVTGKIARSVSVNMKNRFLHPVVRVALISNSKVFLQERAQSLVLNPGKLDYPFEKYMLFNHEINLAARNSIKQMLGDNADIPISFVLKYVFENENTRRLIFLFVANIESEDQIKRAGNMKGKFWTIKQIEDGFADEIFSECFELEFEYLKNMVLAPSDILRKVN